MIRADLRDLAVLTVTDPADAARRVLALSLPREVLWTGLVLAVILNTLLYGLSGMLLPARDDTPALLNLSPAIYLIVLGGGLFLTVHAIHKVGRLMGGQGSLDDVLSLFVWLQFLRVALQAATVVLALVAPVLSLLLVFAASLVVIYIMLHFVDQAHRLQSLARAAGVLIGAAFAIAFALYFLLLFLGAAFAGS